MIARYGDRAADKAQLRARDLLNQDDSAGYDIWMKVAKAIRELELFGVADRPHARGLRRLSAGE
jgi:hypothetical protein